MRLAVIVGSLRKGSFNRKICEIYQALAGEDAQFSEVEISSLPPYNYDVEKHGIPTEVRQAEDIIRQCDGVLIFSPEYNYSIPGVLKNALDWISRVEQQPFHAKPTGIVGASPGRLGTARMQYHLRQVGVTLDMRMLNKPEVMITQVDKKFDHDGVLTDEATKKILRKHFEKFREYIHQCRCHLPE